MSFKCFKIIIINMVGISRKHPIYLKTSMYVPIPFYLVEEQNITSESNLIYERTDNGLIIKIINKKHEK